MASMEPEKAPAASRPSLLLGIVVFLSVLISLATVHFSHPPMLFHLSNLVGPTTESLLEGRGLTTCTEAMGTPANPICFHSGRMPVASLTVAAGIELFGMRTQAVNIFKTLLFLIPVEAAIFLAFTRLPRSRPRRILIAGLLLLPFAMTAFLADVANMQVEEGYSYSLLAFAVAVLLFFEGFGARAWLRAVCFGLAVCGLFLSKSSMLPVALILALAFVYLEKRPWQRCVALLLILAGPAGWAVAQHAASGRYSVGTSLDGINLHKSNNPEFLSLYPPAPGDTLDGHDPDLNVGLRFADEWSFNDYHRRAAVAFIESHPAAVLTGDLRKLGVMFLTVRKIGSADSRPGQLQLETAGFVLFRIIQWAALAGACLVAFRGKHARVHGILFLAVVAGVAFPYLMGFAYTRHVSVLIYPSVLMCCWLLERTESPAAWNRASF